MKGLPTDSSLPLPVGGTKPKSHKWLYLQLFAVLALLATQLPRLNSIGQNGTTNLSPLEVQQLAAFGAVCPVQPKALEPKIKLDLDEKYRKHSAKLLSEAVQIPTESFDDMGKPLEDPRWAPFFEYQKWLKTAFPLAHEKLKTEYINTLGIVNTLEGSDPSLKPFLLLSHYDVVPAPKSTADRWKYGMFSGHVDDEWVWGRGSSDDKTLMVAQYEAVTKLLESGFQPRRTLILAHGFDEEEVGARQGAGRIAPWLEEKYGNNSLLMVVDEGTGTSDDAWGGAFAMPSNREKGYLDVRVTIGTPGGHSSVPPEHTGIGIMSQVIQEIEANPFKTTLTPESPHLGMLACGAQYSPEFPSAYAKLLKNPKKWDRLAELWAKESLGQKALLGTTQAIDIINGGVKSNALPERVEMLMNFRIDFASSIKETQDHLAKSISKIASQHNITFTSFEKADESKLGSKYITAEVFGLPLEPSPDTPESGELWDMFAGTIKAAIPGPDDKERIVSPYSSTGNTDTKMFWNLTPNIYRFMSAPAGSGSGVHTVDEKASIDGHLSIVKWIHAIVQNANDYAGTE